MCTVTFFQDKNNIIITSNRDEHKSRALALAPKKILNGNDILYYPKDPKANGTWFCVKNYATVFVLLNGADKKHTAIHPYRKSRGLILLDLIKDEDINHSWKLINMDNIEPFSLITYEHNTLQRFTWDGSEKKCSKLDISKPHIWSSVTLYDDDVIEKRRNWFSKFLESDRENLTPENFINFHIKTQNEDTVNGLIINRNSNMLTKNVNQCVISKHSFMLFHFDLISNEKKVITKKLI